MSKIDLEALFGVKASDIASQLDPTTYPDVVAGRVLNIDGDFLAYQVSYDDERPITEMMHNHDVAVETLRLLAGAESVVLHITGSDGDKGNRYNIALQKEYQGNRNGKVKPKHLHTIKSWMVHKRGAISHVTQEADDGLCQANAAAVAAGTPELSVLVSKDKDLQMCPGYHLDWDTGELTYVDGFGQIVLDRSKSSPKVIGKGTSFFWAQMLSGDAADNIKGLPSFEANGKRKPCGPVAVMSLLENIKNDKEAFELIKGLYKDHGEAVGFKDYRDDSDVHWSKVFVSEAKLLWMRRNVGENDVIKFFKEVCV